MLSKILIIGMLPAAMALAQWGGARKEDPSASVAPRQSQSQFGLFADKLKLDKEQRVEAETIVDAAHEAMGPAQQKLSEARKNLAAALITSQSAEVVDKLTQAYTSLSAQTKLLEANAFGKICALLKPNQQSKAVQNFGLMAQLVESGQMGGGQWSGSQQGQWGAGRGGRQ